MFLDLSGDFNESDTIAFARTMLNFHPDPIQARVLDPNIRRGILNCCRQWGKSTILAIHPDSLTLSVLRPLPIPPDPKQPARLNASGAVSPRDGPQTSPWCCRHSGW